MGIHMTSNYKGAPSLDGSCSMLFRIRSRLAKAWDAEFGEHYSKLLSIWREEDFKAFDRRTEQILSDSRFTDEDDDLIEFWFMSDCEGKVHYKTCKKLADLLTLVFANETIDFAQNSLRYQAYSGHDWEDLMTLFKGCYSHRANLIWS